MHLVKVDDIRAQPSQRILDLLADASGSGIAIDGTVFPCQADFGGDRHLLAQRAFERLADDPLGAAEAVDRSGVDAELYPAAADSCSTRLGSAAASERPKP